MSYKVKDALQKLVDIGFEPRLTKENYKNIVAAGFDVRTLPQSFALAQILLDEQPITVRGGFYRAVSAGIYPDTEDKHYRQVGGIILKLRRAGIIPYSWIADSTRLRIKPSSWSGLADYADAVRDCYRKNFWAEQEEYVEVIVEKDAMAGVLRPITDEFDIHLNIIRGNASESFVWRMAEELRPIEKRIFIYYLGDHDPNGLDIERDIKARLTAFMGPMKPWHLNWTRIAVTEEQFARQDLLGFPVRQSAGRAWAKRRSDYIELHGDRCVEVDAIPAKKIRELLRFCIEEHISREGWERLKAVEEMERETIIQAFGRVA